MADALRRVLAKTSSPRSYHFVRALVVRFQTMRFSPGALLTTEGVDAAEAIVIALVTENWRPLTHSKAMTLSKAWTELLSRLVVLPEQSPRPSVPAPARFNQIKVK
jgi:hypothetical protein